MDVNRISKCRVCGETVLKSVFDMGMQCLGGRFPKIGEQDPPMLPLELIQCDVCGLVQLAHDVPLDEMYRKGYGYLSGINNSMKEHLREIAETALSLVEIKEDDTIIDIGCNDGTLLKSYKCKANKIGFDSKHYWEYYLGTDIRFIPSFFDGYDKQAKIITSIAMFYDLPAPNSFMFQLKRTLSPDGIWILEQSYLPLMLARNAFDTICHEHLEYYCVQQIRLLCDRFGLKIFDLSFNDTNGGSVRLYVCHKESDRKEIPALLEVVTDFKKFDKNVNEIKQKINMFLEQEKNKGKTIHIFGASTKGNVLLQYFGIDYRMISYAADKNKEKWGHWTPCTHIPIVSEEFSRVCRPDYYLVLPWHFKEGFIEQLYGYLDDGGKLLFPLPSPEIISMRGGKIVRRPL